MGDFWVFGYGSLMWNPNFSHDDVQPAHLYGYHRALCIHSFHHRGTEKNPGLVLGLDRGGSCQGLAFHVSVADSDKTYAYLLEREQPNGVYEEKYLTTYLGNGKKVKALAFVADRHHNQYAGKQDIATMTRIVAKASGLSGPNCDYVLNTVMQLRQMKIHDKNLESIAKKLKS